MKWVVEGKDWQQQDALVLSHSREDTEVRSICKNLRLLKVKLTTNPPQYICTGQCSRVLSLAALTKSLQKYSCILVTYHQLSTIPIYLQDHFNRGKEKERLCDSKPVPRKRKSWTLAEASSVTQTLLLIPQKKSCLLHLHPLFFCIILWSLELGSAGTKPGTAKGLPGQRDANPFAALSCSSQ